MPNPTMNEPSSSSHQPNHTKLLIIKLTRTNSAVFSRVYVKKLHQPTNQMTNTHYTHTGKNRFHHSRESIHRSMDAFKMHCPSIDLWMMISLWGFMDGNCNWTPSIDFQISYQYTNGAQ
jgi:hypothetical protein